MSEDSGQHLIAKYARHQTFHPRYGWLKKGADAVARDPRIFSRSDAMLELGVGKNMVDSIKFWCEAFKVIQPADVTSRKLSEYCLTPFAKDIFLPEGVDPFLESTSTLWILHWNALTGLVELPIWYVAMSYPTNLDFSEATLTAGITRTLKNYEIQQPNPSALKKDISCLLRMYTTTKPRKRESTEDILDSQFRQLNLLRESTTPGMFSWVDGAKPGLTPAVVQWAVMDYLVRRRTSSIGVGSLVSEPGSPGRLFKMSEDFMVDSLRRAEEGSNFRIVKMADSFQMQLEEAPEVLLSEAEQRLYSSIRRDLGTTNEIGATLKVSKL
jgi:hypothetical protein